MEWEGELEQYSRGELDSIERDTSILIKEMQKAIAEANAFIESMDS